MIFADRCAHSRARSDLPNAHREAGDAAFELSQCAKNRNGWLKGLTVPIPGQVATTTWQPICRRSRTAWERYRTAEPILCR